MKRYELGVLTIHTLTYYSKSVMFETESGEKELEGAQDQSFATVLQRVMNKGYSLVQIERPSPDLTYVYFQREVEE